MAIKENVQEIRRNIPVYVTLVAAVKYASNEQILELVKSGVKDLGFNTHQQLKKTRQLLTSDARIHFIGHLQSNKVRKVLQENIFLIQSVDSYSLAERINNAANELGIKQNILLQVKTDESKKHGFSALEIEEISLKINNNLKNIKVKGLMTIPPLSFNPEDSRKYFSLVQNLSDNISKKINKKLEYLSMGMSDDYKIAIEEGSNMVRIGRAIFES
ncbi:YggS family pyridoxal phosphate-dependent enzyme [Candidatus Woesearchaeota archaeon]|nr:YggS family pyridoxal phosphate-dependent enzyme [Candidatus Woesearchaeota archaeon]